MLVSYLHIFTNKIRVQELNPLKDFLSCQHCCSKVPQTRSLDNQGCVFCLQEKLQAIDYHSPEGLRCFGATTPWHGRAPPSSVQTSAGHSAQDERMSSQRAEQRVLTLNLTLWRTDHFLAPSPTQTARASAWKFLFGAPGKLRRLQPMRGLVFCCFSLTGYICSLQPWGHLFQWPMASADSTRFSTGFSTWNPQISNIFPVLSHVTIPLETKYISKETNLYTKEHSHASCQNFRKKVQMYRNKGAL